MSDHYPITHPIPTTERGWAEWWGAQALYAIRMAVAHPTVYDHEGFACGSCRAVHAHGRLARHEGAWGQGATAVNEEMTAANLLRSASKLIERALLKLDVSEAPCAHCGTRLFRDRVQAKAYEAFSDTPGKLQHVATTLDGVVDEYAPSRRHRR